MSDPSERLKNLGYLPTPDGESVFEPIDELSASLVVAAENAEDERNLHAELMELVNEDIAPPPMKYDPLRWVDVWLYCLATFVIGCVVGGFAVAL